MEPRGQSDKARSELHQGAELRSAAGQSRGQKGTRIDGNHTGVARRCKSSFGLVDSGWNLRQKCQSASIFSPDTTLL